MCARANGCVKRSWGSQVGNPSNRQQLLSLQEISDGTDPSGPPLGEPTGRRVVLSYFSSVFSYFYL